jgi:hypothetical protein
VSLCVFIAYFTTNEFRRRILQAEIFKTVFPNDHYDTLFGGTAMLMMMK